LQVLIFPQSSVAAHVLVIVLSWGQDPATVTSVNVMVALGSQLSVAVAEPVFAGAVLAVQRTVMLAGHVIAGAVLSSTKIVCVHAAVFPQSSVASHVLEMVSSCGHTPPVVISVNVISTDGSQLSVAVAVPVAGGNVLAVH
jgi:hypothetical protein